MIKETPRAISEPDNYDTRANIMWAGTVANNDILRPFFLQCVCAESHQVPINV